MVLHILIMLTLILIGKIYLLKELTYLVKDACTWGHLQLLPVMVLDTLTVKCIMVGQLILITSLSSLLQDKNEI